MTASRPEVFLPVEAEGQLCLDAPNGASFALVADGDTLHLDVEGWRDLLSFAPHAALFRGEGIRRLAGLLGTCGLTLSVRSADRAILELGPDARPNWFARLLGLAPAHVPLSALGVLFRR